MPDVTDNLLEHQAEMTALINGYNFTSPGKDQSLGRDITVTVAEGIIERTVQEGQAADGSPLKPNEAKYAARKAAKHGVHQVGILTGQMLSLESVLGTPDIQPETITMKYGTGQQPTKYATTGDIKGNEPTDQQKAQFFTDQGRPFYELSGDLPDRVRATIREGFAAHLENH